MPDFDAIATLNSIRELQAVRRRRGRLYTSKLDRHAYELLKLRDAGATASQLHLYLQTRCRVNVALSTVTRWLEKRGA